MLVYAPGWSLASQFWSYTPPKKSQFSRAQKNENWNWNSPLKTVFLIQFFFENFGVLLSLRRKFVTPFSTLAMIQGSLPPNSTTPDRLRSWAKTERESEDFPGFWLPTICQKNKFFRKAHDRILIYTPKEAHSRIFVTGDVSNPVTNVGQKKTNSWGGQLV